MTDRKAFARYLRQRSEMGMDPLILDTLTRRRVLEVAAFRPEGGDTGHAEGPAPGTGKRAPEGESSAAVSASGSEDPTIARNPSETSASQDPYEILKAEALGCTRCRLAQGRTQVVFSDGVSNAQVMVVGEAPGEQEDRTGLPFVGRAGRLLDLLLAAVDLSRRESVYICNVLKCRPPGNRDPLQDELESCSPYLLRQIELVEPEVILAVGTFAAQLLTGMDRPLGRLRGSVHTYHGTPLVVTYHPAALLRNRGWTQATWNDLQLLRQVLHGG